MFLKLLILDIDGVMTDGSKVYDRNGMVIAKRFQDKDFTAIKLLKAAGKQVCFLSSDKFNKAMADCRNIDFFLSRMPDGSINKAKFIPILSEKYNCSVEEMGYIGDDIFDIDIMKLVNYKFCPQDAVSMIKDLAFIINKNGGENVVYHLYEHLVNIGLVEPPTLNAVKLLDKSEK